MDVRCCTLSATPAACLLSARSRPATVSPLACLRPSTHRFLFSSHQLCFWLIVKRSQPLAILARRLCTLATNPPHVVPTLDLCPPCSTHPPLPQADRAAALGGGLPWPPLWALVSPRACQKCSAVVYLISCRVLQEGRCQRRSQCVGPHPQHCCPSPETGCICPWRVQDSCSDLEPGALGSLVFWRLQGCDGCCGQSDLSHLSSRYCTTSTR